MDSADVLRSGLDVLANVVAVVPPGGWDAASPCDGWTARHVAGHLTTVLSSAASVARGQEFAWGDAGDPAAVAGDDPAATLRQAGETARTAVDAADLTQVMSAPMGEMPIGQRLAFPAMDTHLHAWDLSRAWGRPLELDPEVIAFARQSLSAVPEEMLRSPQTFGPALDPPADATPTESLMAFLGRDPRG